MTKGLIALSGLGLGAATMYVADPVEGRRRRARLRDVAVLAPRNRTMRGSTVGLAGFELVEQAVRGARAVA